MHTLQHLPTRTLNAIIKAGQKLVMRQDGEPDLIIHKVRRKAGAVQVATVYKGWLSVVSPAGFFRSIAPLDK